MRTTAARPPPGSCRPTRQRSGTVAVASTTASSAVDASPTTAKPRSSRPVRRRPRYASPEWAIRHVDMREEEEYLAPASALRGLRFRGGAACGPTGGKREDDPPRD